MIETCLRSALNRMSSHKGAENPGQAAKEAACAMSAASRALASCPRGEGELRDRITQAEMILRDLLIFGTQLQCPLGDRGPPTAS